MSIKIWIIAGFLLLLPLAPLPAQADKYGLEDAVKGSGLPTSIQNKTTLPEVVGVVVNAGLSLIGIFFFALMIYAGVVWMKSMGSSEDVEKAKEIIQAAIIGLIVVSAAYAISNFVFSKLGQGSGGGGGAGGVTQNTDGAVCDLPNEATGNQAGLWNCGSGAAKGTACDTGECQLPCNYHHSSGHCGDGCAAGESEDTTAKSCGSADTLKCCYTP